MPSPLRKRYLPAGAGVSGAGVHVGGWYCMMKLQVLDELHFRIGLLLLG